MLPLQIPSPPQGVWHLGAFPIRAYAIAILLGIAVAVWIAGRRFVRRTAGGTFDDVLEITFWAVPFGIVGGRIYHVITTPGPYFGEGGNPVHALFIWEGGLGIWGAVALGAVGAWIGCRRQNIRFPVFADAVAPALLVAQAIGRLGNWFNQELYGAPTDLPWGLAIDPPNLVNDPATGIAFAEGTLFHPTFLYELLWNLAAAALLVWLDRRFRLGHGRVFWAYVALYTLGRGWIELLRVDTAEHVLGLRLNVWTSIVLFLGAVAASIAIGRLHHGREPDARRVIPAESEAPPADGHDPAPAASA
ncbi:prolipoprotein diacylglyceryl transferase [Xylanimonas cellulosilytica DSM 15894]|uniref:Phosphatidylglycerol--prolipoprotein diacylglyceryl transferase n=1 Tax=Xylanimonas cellulosilytica (strain DSM 15894 / JCM 12276 / CECT 5975 / KCTC 9989 / LMG 20990 / NBRC 107835 / XIL07) TaxID=446471 RepID=D1BS40_XYLCX|nr:prolipoprotein diacylglyceryl transferase [Xylanimonas cellulosilytica]ACZ30532.1 prolipoprotein diacylglyceryl transferase [Xylanimonas cellulosilytica DSM 15894]